jgi:hypothetical protein
MSWTEMILPMGERKDYHAHPGEKRGELAAL